MSILSGVKIPKINYQEIELQHLRPHPRYGRYRELTALSEMTLNDLTNMSKEAAIHFLQTHPIFALKTKGAHYHVISGQRTFQVAKAHFADTQPVPVAFFNHLGTDKVAELIDADMLLTALLFSGKKPRYLGRLFERIPSETLSNILPTSFNSKPKFAKVTGFARNTLFPPEKKRTE